MPVYDFNGGESRQIPGPVNKIQCLSGEAIVIDPTTSPATTTSLSADETYEADGKGGLTIAGIDGPRVYVEYTLSPNAPINRDQVQVVVGADQQPERDGFDNETEQRGVKDVMGVPGGTGVQDITGNDVTTEESIIANLDKGEAPTPKGGIPTVPGPDEAPEAHPALRGGDDPVRGDNDPADDKQTGSFESRSKASLYATAKERDLDVTSKSSKEDLVAALRGE